MASPDLSLILACYNEGPTFLASLERIEEYLRSTRLTWEVICIDDKSKDKTSKTLAAFTKKRQGFKAFYHKKNMGRGGTVREGIRKARGRVVGFIDVDLEVSPVYISDFVRAIDGGADLAIASRIYKEEAASIPRFIASKAYVLVVKLMLGLALSDTEAGYKFFNRKKILPIVKRTVDTHWFFDTEIVTRSVRAGLAVREIPVLFIRRGDKQSTVHLFADTLAYIKAIWAFKQENEK